jgi:hypothetical protein
MNEYRMNTEIKLEATARKPILSIARSVQNLTIYRIWRLEKEIVQTDMEIA